MFRTMVSTVVYTHIFRHSVMFRVVTEFVIQLKWLKGCLTKMAKYVLLILHDMLSYRNKLDINTRNIRYTHTLGVNK